MPKALYLVNQRKLPLKAAYEFIQVFPKLECAAGGNFLIQYVTGEKTAVLVVVVKDPAHLQLFNQALSSGKLKKWKHYF